MDYHTPFDQGLTKLQMTFSKKGWLKLLMAQILFLYKLTSLKSNQGLVLIRLSHFVFMTLNSLIVIAYYCSLPRNDTVFGLQWLPMQSRKWEWLQLGSFLFSFRLILFIAYITFLFLFWFKIVQVSFKFTSKKVDHNIARDHLALKSNSSYKCVCRNWREG